MRTSIPAALLSLLLSAAVACGSSENADRGPIGPADSLGSCAAGDFCGGQSDGNCFCDDQCESIGDCCSDYVEICTDDGPTEITFEVDGYVAGALLGNRADAEASWTESCEAWLAETESRFGQLTATRCGERENIASSSFLFVSRPTATVTATLPAGAQLIESRTGRNAAGVLTGNLEPALDSWEAACFSEIDRWRQIYGDRLAGASCPEPTNVASSSRLFESPIQLWLVASPGAQVVGTDYAAGELTGNLEPALASWREACADAAATSAEIGGDGFVVAECSQPEDLASSSRLFASEIEVTFAGDDLVASQPPPVSGDLIGNLGAALSSWRIACDNALRAIAEGDGDRFAGGVCGVPTNVASSSFRFESQPTVWHSP